MVFAAGKKIAGVACSEAGHTVSQGVMEVKVFQALIWKEKKRFERLQFKNELGTDVCVSVQIELGDGGKAGPQTEAP